MNYLFLKTFSRKTTLLFVCLYFFLAEIMKMGKKIIKNHHCDTATLWSWMETNKH